MTSPLSAQPLLCLLAFGVIGATGCDPDRAAPAAETETAMTQDNSDRPTTTAGEGIRQNQNSAGTAAPDTDETAGTPQLTAIGQEPGWSLTIGAEEAELLTDYGQNRATFKAPAPEPVNGGVRYALSDNVVATVRDTLCQDPMSGMNYPKSVTVETPDQTLEGCGGAPEDLLTGPEWVVEDIAQGGIIDSSRVTLNFQEEGRVSGMASCNTYNASYSITGEGLSFERAMSTKKACAPALMNQENRFLTALSGIDRFEISDTGALVLYSRDTPAITARR